MRRTARVSSKPRPAPARSAPPAGPSDPEFWKGETGAEPDAQWLRTLDAPTHDGDPAFDLAAPQTPIAELLPDAPADSGPTPAPVAAESGAPAAVAAESVPAPPEPEPESPPLSLFMPAAPAVAPIVEPADDVEPVAVVEPTAAAPVATIEVAELPAFDRPVADAAPDAAPDVAPDVAPDAGTEPAPTSRRARRARRSLFGYAKHDEEAEASDEPVGASDPDAGHAPPAPRLEWPPAPPAEPDAYEPPAYETVQHEAIAELVPERVPEGTSTADWLQPANDDLLPQF